MPHKLTYEELEQKVHTLEKEILDHQFVQKEQLVMLEVLQLINETDSLKDLLEGILFRMKKWSGCEAVGIRLKDGPDFPYYVTSGFPEQFVMLENRLCIYNKDGDVQRDQEGKPLLECMCGNILQGRFDPSKNFNQ